MLQSFEASTKQLQDRLSEKAMELKETKRDAARVSFSLAMTRDEVRLSEDPVFFD